MIGHSFVGFIIFFDDFLTVFRLLNFNDSIFFAIKNFGFYSEEIFVKQDITQICISQKTFADRNIMWMLFVQD